MGLFWISGFGLLKVGSGFVLVSYWACTHGSLYQAGSLYFKSVPDFNGLVGFSFGPGPYVG